MEHDIHYAICKMLHWDDFVIVAHGVEHSLQAPEGEKVVGFIPVYANRIDAEAVANGNQIVAVKIGCGLFHEEQGDSENGRTTETS